MNFAFKAFFHSADETEAAYHALRSKNLVTDLEVPDLPADFPNRTNNTASQIAYGLEGNTMLASSGTTEGISSASVFSTNDPRVAMTPLLLNEKQTSANDACFLYGHCRKKDIEAVTACLKRNGAYSVLSSDLHRKNRIQF